MIFKLTDEQINYIIEMYGGSKATIHNVEKKLNLIGVIEDEEDYFELVISIISQKETINLKLEKCDTKNEKMTVYMTFDQIIEIELNRKYNNFEDAKESTKQKMKKFY